MTEPIAKAIFLVLISIGAVVWWRTLLNALRLGTRAKTPPGELAGVDDQRRQAEPASEIELPGATNELIAALARWFRQLPLNLSQARYRIVEQTDERLCVEKTGPLLANQPPQLAFTDAEFCIARARSGVAVVCYRLDFARLETRVRRIMLGIICGVGLPVFVIVGCLIWFLVIPNPNPAVRWQVLQTLQISHALWPPFLFAKILSTGKRYSAAYIEQLLADLTATNATPEDVKA